jgi:hypothetical protein
MVNALNVTSSESQTTTVNKIKELGSEPIFVETEQAQRREAQRKLEEKCAQQRREGLRFTL